MGYYDDFVNQGMQEKWNAGNLPDNITITSVLNCKWLGNPFTASGTVNISYINNESWTQSSSAGVLDGMIKLNSSAENMNNTADSEWACFNVTNQFNQGYLNGNANITLRI